MSNYIDDNINEYITSIYLNIEANTVETDKYYIQLLNNENILIANKIKIIKKVETLINNVNDVKDLALIKPLLAESRILATWMNLIDIYVQNENEFIAEITSFINIVGNAEELSKNIIKKDMVDKEIMKSFLDSLVLNDDIKDEIYSNILSSISCVYSSLSFERLSFGKVKSLVKNNNLVTNTTNFDQLKNNFKDLHILLVENNPTEFIQEIDSFEIEDEDLLNLLKSDIISIELKIEIIESCEISIFISDSVLLTQVGKLLLENSDMDIDDDIIKAVGTDSNLNELDKIKLFNKCNEKYCKESISTLLTSLSKPYCSIAENGKRPLLDDNEINREFVGILKHKGYISKSEIEKVKGKSNKIKGIRISTFRNK